MAGNRKHLLPKSSLSAVLFLANHGRQFDAEVREFLDGVETGQGLFKSDPRLTLREWHIANRTRGHRMTTAVFFAAIVRAWNAYATGKTLMALKSLTDMRRSTLPIVGFDRSVFPEISDAQIVQKVQVRSNLSKANATPAMRFDVVA